jgi:hypothetical protein
MSIIYSYAIVSNNLRNKISDVATTLHMDKKSWNFLIVHLIYAFGNLPYGFETLRGVPYIIFNIFLLIIGISYSLIIYGLYGRILLITLILTLIWVVNVKVGIFIPYFSYLYELERGCNILLVLTPIFYGFGAMYIYELKNKYLKVILGIFTIISIYLTFTSSYAILGYSESYYITVSEGDFNTYNWINSNNITNETFMGQFIHDGHRFFLALHGIQYIPLYTQNKILFCYTNYWFYLQHYHNVRNWTYSYNYSAFLNFSKAYNNSYIYYSDNYPQSYKFNKNFFENETYFQKVYENGTTTLYKIK